MGSPVESAVDLSWIVVTHDSARDLPVLLHSLVPALRDLSRRGTHCELILVDNHSSDGSADLAARMVPWATRIANIANRGYGAAVNQALEVARGGWVAFGNADLYLPRGALSRLPGVLARQPAEVAVVGPAMHGSDGRPSLSAGRFPGLATLLTGLLRACHRRKYLHERRHVKGSVDWVTGACLFARADWLARVGGFDERFFLYYEDVDLARRLAVEGGLTVFEPELSVIHVRPHHGRPPQPSIEQKVRESRRTYFEHHRPRFEQLALEWLGRWEPVVRRRSRLAPTAPSLPRPHPGLMSVTPLESWRLPPLVGGVPDSTESAPLEAPGVARAQDGENPERQSAGSARRREGSRGAGRRTGGALAVAEEAPSSHDGLASPSR